MSEEGAIAPLDVKKHLAALVGAAFLLCGAALLLPSGFLPLIGVATGATASFTVADLAWRQAARARRFNRGSGERARGRIVEHREGGRLILELPGEGLEPWAFDAWVIGVATLAVVILGAGAGRPVLYVFLAFLFAIVAARLFTMRNDRIRLELSSDGFSIDAVGANHKIERTGRGVILPELEPDALTLWSSAGRLGVLRSELTAAERAWLADRLAVFAESTAGSAASQADEQVDQEHAREHGKSQKREHAE
jgi:hypothetical protein